MAKDKDLERFLQKWLEPPPKPRSRAAEILAGGLSLGPRREKTTSGNSRWVTKLGSRPNFKRLTRSFPPL